MGKIYIGIDTGVNTGFAVWNVTKQCFTNIETVMIHKAMDWCLDLINHDIFVIVEDARQRKWFGNAGKEQLQGAGSIKRDAKIWEDFLTDKNIPFQMIAPKNNRTKLDSKTFKLYTGWKEKTNVHGRDAAMLIFKKK